MGLVYALIIIALSATDGQAQAVTTTYFCTLDFCDSATPLIQAAVGEKVVLVCVPTGGVGQ
jgi:hypothetical protein